MTRPSNTLDWKPKEVTGAVVGLMDKKSGEVQSVCQSCGHVRCRAKEDSHNVCALAHTESTVLEDTELFKL